MRARALPLAIAVLIIAGFGVILAAAPGPKPHGVNCGGVLYKADGTRWQCTFDDEFNSGRLDTSKWAAQTNLATGDPYSATACFEDTPSSVSVSGGSLHLGVARQTAPLTCSGLTAPTYYTAGQVTTYHLFSQVYGRFEARVRTAATLVPGLHEAFWLWPDDGLTSLNWPATGEIDVAETYSHAPHDVVPYLHYTANDNGGPIYGVNTSYCAAERGLWNTYDLVWTPTSITISINGQTCLVNTSTDPAFNHRYILSLSDTLGFGSDALSAGTPIPATTDVDYVRVWQ